MMKHLHTLILLLAGFLSLQAQTVYEDFEGDTAVLAWATFNGLIFEGPIENPDKEGVNTSDFVGKFVNDGVSDFSFGLATLAAPADLSEDHLFKIKIWSPIAPIQALFKMEGTGPAIEKFIQIEVANEWVEYTVDFSAAKDYTGLSKILLAFNPFTTPQNTTFYFDDIIAVPSVAMYETFETGNEMGWNALDGTLEAPVDNPAPNSVNMSAQVGKYTKSGEREYSLLLAESDTPYDLSVLNQMKLQIYTNATTQVLLKMEGTGGPAIEKIANIAVSGAWQEYTFDFSDAKDYTHLNKVILFFDPGVLESDDEYYFDNFSAVAAGVCADAEKDPSILDDFECNRNATYSNGWDSLTVVANPAPNPVNTSAFVGRYNDPLNEDWAALIIDSQNDLDLSVNNQLNIKIWSPKETRVLFKLEGGASPAKEVWADITETNQWIDYSIDFSSEELTSHKKIVMFFNAGNATAEGDYYLIDDIYWGEATITDLENFEDGATLPWEPLDQQTLIHGIFEVVANPDATGINTSTQVGKYTKGTSQFSTLAAVAPGVIDITTKPQYNLDILAPEGSTSVTMQLESISSGNKEVTRDLASPGSWETISFDFSDFQTTTDWAALKLIFNPGVAEAGTVFYFDNLRQGLSTVDACEDVVAIPNIIDDFECQRNYEYGAGNSMLSVVNNPLLSAQNASTKVGLFEDTENSPWTALCAEIPEGIDLSVFNQLQFQALSTSVVPVLLKLEGGTSPAKEIWSEISEANKWTTVIADFSSEIDSDHKRVCIFLNAGVDVSPAADYYVDNIKFAHAPYDGCIINFDEPAFTSTTWSYFPSDDAGGFELVDNPLKEGINMSDKVGKAIEKASGEQPWQGMFTNLESYIAFDENTIVKMKLLSPQVGAVTMKIEGPQVEGFPGSSGDHTITNTKANEWEELTWDFSLAPNPIDPAGRYARVTLIFDINNLPTQDVIYYFDDIRLENGDCGSITSFEERPKVESLIISPNPVHDVLKVNTGEGIKRLEIFNMLGQQVATIWNDRENTQYIDVSQLKNGTYVILGYNNNRQIVSQSRFIRM